jgi:hypothetical protein
MQDARMEDGLLAEVPRHFLEAYVAGLAAKCAELYAPALAEGLMMRAAGKFKNAADRDAENAPLRIVPAMGIYTNSVY